MHEPLTKVALAIASFRSDDSVVRMLASVFSGDRRQFGAVIVVDSLGSGKIPDEIASHGWSVLYVNADENLGSAGNLALRLKISAELGFDWCYTLNHDAAADAETAAALLACADRYENIGACYPALAYSRAGGRTEPPRANFTLFSQRKDARAKRECDVAWGSSNFALYNLAAVRQGIAVWSDLWMCWEDLAYGWQLANSGWRQIQCSAVRVLEDFEYKPISFLGRQLHVTEKPSWYMYYELRNLVIIARRSRWRAVTLSGLIAKALTDLALIAFFKRDRFQRTRLLFRGLIAALRGETGKGPVP